MNEELLGHVLEALEAAGGTSESSPDVPGMTRDEALDGIAELLDRGWVTAGAKNAGDGRLLAVRNVRMSASGRVALGELRRKYHGTDGRGGDLAVTSLDEKKRQRLEYMKALYEATGGSTNASVDMWQLGEQMGWSRPVIDATVEYLAAEILLEYVAIGGQIGITHHGVVEVEESESHPDQPTAHFPAINILNVETMVGSNIQQGSPGSSQHVEYVATDVRSAAIDVIRDLRDTVLPVIDLAPDDRDELETELDVAERHLKSSRPKTRAVRRSLQTAAGLLTKATVVTGSAVQLAEHIEKLHKVLPGI